MFIQRENEISVLEDSYNAPRGSIDLVYGARNTGKTTLINEYTKDKDKIYFSNYEMISSWFFTQMANSISNFFHNTDVVGKPFDSFIEVLEFLNEQKIEKKLIIVFDDFQNILKVDKNSLNSLIGFYKRKLKNKNIQIIIATSSYFPESLENELNNIASSVSHLKYLNFMAIKEFFPTMNKLDQLYVYSLLGTSPANLKYYNPKIEFSENIYNLYLSKNSYLFDYGIKVLKSEISDIGTYSSILYAIAKGNSKAGDIASFLNVKSTYLSRYLQKLVEMMIVEKIVPIDEDKKASKFGRYVIIDNALKFWFCYIYPNLSSLQQDNVKDVSKIIQDKFVSDTVFTNYKKCIKEYIYTKQESIFTYKPHFIGSWWDNQNSSIDLIAYDKKTVTFVQILWEDKKVAQIEYGNLKSSSDKFNTSLEKKYIIITKDTFLNIM